MTPVLFTFALYLLTLGGAEAAQPPKPPGNEDWWTPTSPDGVQRVAIQCSNNSFDPRTIIVKANRPVEFTLRSLKNNPNIAFVMNYPGAQINEVIDPRKPPVRFQPVTVGRYTLLCRPTQSNAPIDPKKDEARTGTLVVVR